MKIKLVAIAKDESAYLPEWIFHHLFFGFDEIEIYINFTTDNSCRLLEKIQLNHPIKFRNAEYLTELGRNNHDQLIAANYLSHNQFQSRAYAELLVNARIDGFSHIMFLDIDELWTPVCFKNKIQDVLNTLGDPDVAYFEWQNKVSDLEEFGRPFQKEILVTDPDQVKCIVKTNIDIELKSSHRVSLVGRGHPKIANASKISTAFVLHRFQRSQHEYISMLGRGDPTFAGKPGLKFNRAGYIDASEGAPASFDIDLIDNYDTGYEGFLKMNELSNCVIESKAFVEKKHLSVIDYVNQNKKTNRLIKRLFKGIPGYDHRAVPGVISPTEIASIQDIAISLESYDLEKAYELMKIALQHKPNGPILKKKCAEYRSRLKARNALDKR